MLHGKLWIKLSLYTLIALTWLFNFAPMISILRNLAVFNNGSNVNRLSGNNERFVRMVGIIHPIRLRSALSAMLSSNRCNALPRHGQ